MQKNWSSLNCTPAQESSYPEEFDTIIIGAGPAGMTAAIYAARRKLKTLLIAGNIGGQMNWCSDIENWTGVIKSTGPELVRQFERHIKTVDHDNAHFDLWIREGEKVTGVTKKDAIFFVNTDEKQTFKSKTIVCTAGKKPRTLGIPGEEIAMEGNGLSFAATSDAPLYKGKKMAIIGGGNSAMDVAIQLSKFTEDITLMTNLDHLIGEAVLMEKIEKNPHIHILYEVQTHEIELNLNNKVSGIRISIGDREEEIFECEGIFEEIGQTPATNFLSSILELNEQNEIPVDRNMNTTVPGFFAAGDCTDEIHKQTIVAAGQGAIAALEAHKYLIKQ